MSAIHTFYRIVQNDPPAQKDFRSLEALGRKASPSLTPEQQLQWAGVSVFTTLEQARRQAQRYPRLGRFIAELVIPDDGPIRFERTNPNSPGHHTLWGGPEELQQSVVNVEPAKSEEDGNGHIV